MKELISFFLSTEQAVVDEVGGQRMEKEKGYKGKQEIYEVTGTGAQASRRRYSEQDVAGWGGGCEPLILPIHYPPWPCPKPSHAISYT